MTISLDGYVTGPADGPADPLGKHAGMAIFDWYFSGSTEYRDPLFKPEPGENLAEVQRMFEKSGAFILGDGRTTSPMGGTVGIRRTIHPSFILTHQPPPARAVPRRLSAITFVTDDVESAVRQAKAAAAPGMSNLAVPHQASRPYGWAR